jgi:hypothetical protein
MLSPSSTASSSRLRGRLLILLMLQVTGQQVNPRQVAGLKVGVSSKLTPKDGGDLAFEEYPQVVEEIIANAS